MAIIRAPVTKKVCNACGECFPISIFREGRSTCTPCYQTVYREKYRNNKETQTIKRLIKKNNIELLEKKIRLLQVAIDEIKKTKVIVMTEYAENNKTDNVDDILEQ